jgi:hypothetical protein
MGEGHAGCDYQSACFGLIDRSKFGSTDFGVVGPMRACGKEDDSLSRTRNRRGAAAEANGSRNIPVPPHGNVPERYAPPKNAWHGPHLTDYDLGDSDE